MYKFDGTNYTSYNHNWNNTSSINSNFIYCAYLDSKNRLWVGTNVGLNLYNRDLDKFERIDLTKVINKNKTNTHVKCLKEDGRGNLLIGTYGDGLLKITLDSLQISKIQKNEEEDSLLIYTLKKSKNGEVFIGTDRGLKMVVNNKLTPTIPISGYIPDYDGSNISPLVFNNDGDIDLVAGNLGLNYKYKAKNDETFDIYFNDFDGNKRNDIVLSYYNEGKKYPIRGRECSAQQMPSLKKKFENYNKFSTAQLTDIYDKKKLEKGLHYQVRSFSSAYLENKDGKFIVNTLPNEAQLSPINQMIVKDFDKDGHLDILGAGNLYASEVETPRADAGHGLFLRGNGNGSFRSVPTIKTGFYTGGDVKDLILIKIKGEDYILSVKNNDFLQFIKYR